MKNRYLKAGVLALGAALLSAAASAGPVYKWVDPAGHFHFSDTPQPGWKRVEVRSANAATSEIPQIAGGVDDTQRALDCKQKRDTLAGYRKASKIVERDALGQEREYSDEQKNQLIARAEQQAQNACADVPASDADPE